MTKDRQQYLFEELNHLGRVDAKRNEYNILMEKKLVSVIIMLFQIKANTLNLKF